VAALAGCEWFSTMADNPGISPHEREPLLPPPHAIALDGLPEFDLVTAEQVLTPPPFASDSLAYVRADSMYRTFCLVCHGASGTGAGPISQVFPAIPALNTDRVAGYSDTYIFALISKGRGLMPEYSRIPPATRWEIVRYLRSFPRGAGGAAPAGAGAAPAPAPTRGAPGPTGGAQ
jgi:hypothetical protein